MNPWESYRAGTLVKAGPGVATVLPDFDYETFSTAGYEYDPDRRKWGSLRGLSNNNRGLTAVGARNYVEHPSFCLLSLAWDLKDGRGRRWWRPVELDDLFPATRAADYTIPWDSGELCDYVASGGIIEAFNIDFEYIVWNYYCVPKLGWPWLHQRQLRCAMAKSRAAAYPGSLDDAGKVLKLIEQKDPRGEKLVRKLTVPRNPTRANPDLRWTPFTAKEEFQTFYEYNRQDIRSEFELSLRVPDLSPRELEVWNTHFTINQRGMYIDRASVENCIAVIEQCFEKYNAELRYLTNGIAQNTSEVEKILVWAAHQGVTLYNLDEESLTQALSRTDYPPIVLRVLRLRQMLAFGSVKKLYAFLHHTNADGRLRDQYVYYGAHTGLWNGRAVQPANLYKGIFSKPHEAERALGIIASRCLELVEYEYPNVDPLEVVASCLRSLIVASPGNRLISADFTAIQAVATACLAGEQWRIDVFRTHGKIYESMAALLTGKTLEFYADYKKQHGKHHEDRQKWGKLPVLSGDFGAGVSGWKRFHADKIIGDDQAIKQAIRRTRATIPQIVEMWGGQTRNKFGRDAQGNKAAEYRELYGLEGAAISAVLEPGRAFGYRGMVYEVYEDTLYCRPPSGGFIRYHKPRLRRSDREWASEWELAMSYEGWNSNAQKAKPGWQRMDVYGGVFTQNNVSHMCREIQADALMALERNGYPVVMHTHDENVADVPMSYGSAQHYTQVIRDSRPAWAVCDDGQPWPIKIPDAWEAQRYGKWED